MLNQKKPNIGTVSVDKYVYVDLLEYELPEESNTILEKRSNVR